MGVKPYVFRQHGLIVLRLCLLLPLLVFPDLEQLLFMPLIQGREDLVGLRGESVRDFPDSPQLLQRFKLLVQLLEFPGFGGQQGRRRGDFPLSLGNLFLFGLDKVLGFCLGLGIDLNDILL